MRLTLSTKIIIAFVAAMFLSWVGLLVIGYALVGQPFHELLRFQQSLEATELIKSSARETLLYSLALMALIGVVGGVNRNGKLYFDPNATLTRAQAAAMIGRTQEKGFGTAELKFTDSAKIPAYASFYIQTMVYQGILSGYADGSFGPGASITRGQMAKILYHLL